MNTRVDFRSSKFPAYEGEEDQINPGLWGKRSAEYLVHKLAERGSRKRLSEECLMCDVISGYTAPGAHSPRAAVRNNKAAPTNRTTLTALPPKLRNTAAVHGVTCGSRIISA